MLAVANKVSPFHSREIGIVFASGGNEGAADVELIVCVVYTGLATFLSGIIMNTVH